MGPHENQPLETAGAPLEDAKAAMIMIHGRGAVPADILGLSYLFKQPDFAYLAPQAANRAWYPYGFMEPLDKNEPGISSALAVVAALLEQIAKAGIPAERTMLLGFSQGACLSVEFAARNARRYGGLAALSGGLIGPDGSARDYSGTLDGTPVFIGCSDVDPHIPKARVEHTAEILGALGGDVNMQLYPGMEHTVIQDEIDIVRAMMENVIR